MDPLLVAAIKARHPIVHLVTVTLPAYTIRWTDGGFVVWGANTYRAKDAIYGSLDSISEIVDGVGDDASPVTISILPPDLSSVAALTAADAQGGAVEIHLGAVNRTTGALIGEPYRLTLGELDQPTLRTDRRGRRLDYDIISADARGLEPNEEQRQSDAFHQSIWPGELHYEFQTDATQYIYWRDDEDKNAVNGTVPRGRGGAVPTEFNYDTDAGLPFPMGRVAVGGTINKRVSYDATNRYQSIFYTLAASGPITAWVADYFDDEATTFDATLNKATNGAHEGFMWLLKLPGTSPQAALTSPTGTGAGIPAPGWTADHKASGRAVAVWTGFENSKKTEFQGGVPKPLHVIQGLKGWDPSDAGSEIDDTSTWAYIDDGARWGLNWAIGRWEGPDGLGSYGTPYLSSLVGGIAAPFEAIDVDGFEAAADVADTHNWKVAAVPFSNEDKFDVLADLLMAAGAEPARKCGMVSCVSFAAAQTSVLTATERDTAGPVEAMIRPSRLDRRNTAVARFWSEDHRWEMTPIAPVTNPDWKTEDGGKRSTSYDFRYVPDADQAAILTYYRLADAREAVGNAIPFKPYMLQLQVGDCFNFDAPELLFEGKFKVRRREYDPATTVVKLTIRGETDAKHTDAYEQTGITPPPAVPTEPPPPYVEPPSEFAVTVDAGTVTVQYRNPNTTLHDFVNIYRAMDSTTFADAAVIDFYGGGAGELVAVEDTPTAGHDYSYWLVAVDVFGNEADPVGPETVTV